jgi:membrane fusion protein (multidrug efflux system)
MSSNGKPRKARILIPLGIILLLAIITAGYWYIYLRGYVSTDDAYIDADALSVSPKIPGRIVQLNVDEGDTVAAGEILAQLDDSDLRAEEAQAQASLEYARQAVSLAEVNVQKAQEDFTRSKTQYKQNVIPKEKYDHSRQALEVAQAQKKLADAQVNNTQAHLGVILTQLDNTIISTPQRGIVARKWVLPGDIVQPGQPMYTIYNLDSIWVTANLEETKLAAVRLGDKVSVSVDAYSNLQVTGRVILIGSAAASEFSLIPPNNASGNFTKVTQRVPIRIAIDDESLARARDCCRLLPGMSVEIKVTVDRH